MKNYLILSIALGLFPLSSPVLAMDPPPLNEEEVSHLTSSLQSMQIETDEQIHTRLLGKCEKLESIDGVYVGAGFSKKGERIYYGMEKIYPGENDKIWYAYGENTKRVIKPLNGFRTQCVKNRFPSFATTPASAWFNFDDEYRSKLKTAMDPQLNRLLAILSGSGTLSGQGAFNIELSGPGYVSYASNKPIKGRFSPEISWSGSLFSLQEFEKTYEPIVMSYYLSEYDKDSNHPDCDEHRGIYKNPFHDIYGNFRDMSLEFHGWGAFFAMNCLENKTAMRVTPTRVMANILQQKVPSEDIAWEPSYAPEGQGVFQINLKALSKFYLDSSKKNR